MLGNNNLGCHFNCMFSVGADWMKSSYICITTTLLKINSNRIQPWILSRKIQFNFCTMSFWLSSLTSLWRFKEIHPNRGLICGFVSVHHSLLSGTIPGPGSSNRMQPSLIVSVKPVLFQLWQAKICCEDGLFFCSVYRCCIHLTNSNKRKPSSKALHTHTQLFWLIRPLLCEVTKLNFNLLLITIHSLIYYILLYSWVVNGWMRGGFRTPPRRGLVRQYKWEPWLCRVFNWAFASVCPKTCDFCTCSNYGKNIFMTPGLWQLGAWWRDTDTTRDTWSNFVSVFSSVTG